MDVIRHDDGSMECKSVSLVVQAVPKNNLAGLRWKRIPVELAESHEYPRIRLLIVRQPPPVFIFVCDKLHIGPCGADTPVRAKFKQAGVSISIPAIEEEFVSNRQPLDL
jgi:hypothetical protein